MGRRAQLASNIEASAVIFNFHRNEVTSTHQGDSDAMGVGMRNNIGESSLKHPVERCFATRRQFRVKADDIEPDLDSSPSGELPHV